MSVRPKHEVIKEKASREKLIPILSLTTENDSGDPVAE
jgi:hypothetical protein